MFQTSIEMVCKSFAGILAPEIEKDIIFASRGRRRRRRWWNQSHEGNGYGWSWIVRLQITEIAGVIEKAQNVSWNNDAGLSFCRVLIFKKRAVGDFWFGIHESTIHYLLELVCKWPSSFQVSSWSNNYNFLNYIGCWWGTSFKLYVCKCSRVNLFLFSSEWTTLW